jgi:hypothetical protein
MINNKKLHFVGQRYIRLILYIFIVSIAIYLNVKIFEKAIGNQSGDFQWQPTRELLQHINPYDSYLCGKLFMAQAPNYPLTGYILLVPYALMEWKYAKIAWALTNYIATFLIIFCLQKIWQIKSITVIIFTCSLFLISNPYRNVINNGQHDLFVLALFLVSLVSTKDNKYLSGIFLGLSWFKFTITFPLSLIYIFKRGWLQIAIGILLQCFLFIAICFWLNQSPVYIISSYMKVISNMGKSMNWFPYRQYNYVVFMIPIWYSIFFVENKFLKPQGQILISFGNL